MNHHGLPLLPLLLPILSSATLSSPTQAQGDWTRLAPATSPVPLSDVAMAYDAARDRVVLHGGWDGTKDLADTWEFDGTTFRKVATATSPGPRSTHGMVFDAARKRVLMFGGYCGQGCAIGSTWTFDGNDWTQQKPAASPAPRMGFGIAYDPERDRVVLFGGFCGSTSCVFGDTWEWDGKNWSRILTNTSPPARFSTRMVFDSRLGRIVLYGGRGATTRYGDTWVFDGRDWQRLTPRSAPGIRTSHGMVFDELRGRTVLFGGYDGGGHSDQTWEFDGVDWLRRTPTSSPSGRSFFAMAYDGKRGRSLLFGGGDGGVVGGLFAYASRNPASYTPVGRGCAGTAGTPVLRAEGGALPWIGDTLPVVLTGIAGSARVAVFGLGLSDTAWGPLPLPYDLGPWGAPGCLVLAAFDLGFLAPVQRGSATFRFPVPNAAAAIGVTFFNQAFAADPANRLGLVMSNSCRGVIGAR